jgi:hypothetical protein
MFLKGFSFFFFVTEKRREIKLNIYFFHFIKLIYQHEVVGQVFAIRIPSSADRALLDGGRYAENKSC